MKSLFVLIVCAVISKSASPGVEPGLQYASQNLEHSTALGADAAAAVTPTG